MARTVISPVSLTPAGAAPSAATPSDPTNGNSVVNSASLVLTLDNSAGETAVSAVFVTVAKVGGYEVEDVTVDLAAGAVLQFGHFAANVFGGTVQFTTDAAVDVTAVA